MKNRLCFGDNLTFLNNASLFPDECVDMVYLDPPFNSQRGYNVLFKEVDGTPSVSQIQAFDDTWQWDADADNRYLEIQATAPGQVVAVMGALQIMLGHSPMFAYLVQMCARLVQLHRVLKKKGSLYLHCDPTASHYLKMVLDSIFGPRCYRNEIIWQRTSAHANVKQSFGKVHDILFFYTKTDGFTWNQLYSAYEKAYIELFFDQKEPNGRRYSRRDLTASMQRASSGQLYEWKGVRPPPSRCWAMTKENMDQLEADGRIHWPKAAGGMPRLKFYEDEAPGIPLQDIWADIKTMHNLSSERLGYPTQKPVELLKRIILASSNPGDVVLDPFCGCGTTIDAVETINRENPDQKKRVWIGIDVTYLAVTLIKNRLARFTQPTAKFEILGEPEDAKSAEYLAIRDRHEFQYWALGLIGARPWNGQKKKGADKGIDGVRFFNDEGPKGKLKTLLVQVKSGKVKSGDIRDFRGTMEREKAPMGVFLTLESPTKDMEKEAMEAGKYLCPWNQESYSRIQILTVEQLLADDGRPNPHCLRMPPSYVGETFKQAQRADATSASRQLDML